MNQDKTRGRGDSEKNQILAIQVSIWASFALFLISVTIGIMVDSVTLLLDASCSMVIMAVAFLARASIKNINKPPDDHYHFGYGKYEPLAIALQGIAIIATCLAGIKFAIQDMVHAENITRFDIPAIAAFVSGIIGLVVAVYLKKSAKRMNSSILKSASLQWYIDTALSFSVCVGFGSGLVLKRLGYIHITPYIDPAMAIMLGLLFMKMPIRTVTYSMLELLDAAPPKDIRKTVNEAVKKCKPESFGISRLRCRKAGGSIFLDICFIIDKNATVEHIRQQTIKFEEDLLKQINNCDIVIHYTHA